MMGQRSQPVSRKRKAIKVIISIILILILTGAAAAAVFHKPLIRLYHVITLFEREKIVSNFRNMEKIFVTRTVKKGTHIRQLPKALRSIPSSFSYKNETIDTHQYIKESWTTGLMVIKDGTILFEEYYRGQNENSRAISWSMGKSIVSALIGIAMEEGRIDDLHRPVSEYVPFLKGTGYDGITLKNVLQMSSGIMFNEDYGDFHSDINRMGRTFALNTPMDDFVASLKQDPAHEQGTYNHYVSMDTQVLGMVLRETVGMNLSRYLEEKIWKPAGMESDARWIIDNAGMEAAFGGLNAVMRDYGRFGLLYLENGEYNGRQIIPKQWIKASVTPDAPHLMPGENPDSDWVMGYGYQWWIPENSDGDYMAIGIYNQNIYIDPDSRTVIVKLSAYPDYNRDGEEKTFRNVALFRTIVKEM